jgi:hypothetical protein
MSNIKKLYFPEIQNNSYMMDVFDFDKFLNKTQFSFVIGDTNGNSDVRKVMTLMRRLLRGYDLSNQNIKTFIDNNFSQTLFNFILDESFAPALQSEVGSHLFNAKNVRQVSVLSNNIQIIFNGAVDYSDLKTLQTQFENLDNKLFRFGKQLKQYGEGFDIAEFKDWFTKLLVQHFYPYLYFIHIQKALQFCDDFKCKRVYILAKFVYVYFTLMALFLVVYSNAASVTRCISVLQTTQSDIDNTKERLQRILDSILGILDEENILDKDNDVSKMAEYYNSLKATSQDNQKRSHDLNTKRDTALNMQNNLSSILSTEAMAYRDLWRAKVIFYVVLALILMVICTQIVFILQKQYTRLFILSGLTLLALAIYAFVTVVKYFIRDYSTTKYTKIRV